DHALKLVQGGRLRHPSLTHCGDGESVVAERSHYRLGICGIKGYLAHVEAFAEIADAGLDGAVIDHIAWRRCDVTLFRPSRIGNAVAIGARPEIVAGNEEMWDDVKILVFVRDAGDNRRQIRRRGHIDRDPTR